ncbi:MAG: L-lysine 2,3-aminomutase [Chlamydiae bacterium]|nr:L-lysine 2,3-aminomutase [Chlamydiota bacterium]
MPPRPQWREVQKQNFTCINRLTDYLELDTTLRNQLIVNKQFILNLPLRLAQKIEKNRIDDPILRQFVPLQEEREKKEGFSVDPVKEGKCRPTPHLLHKYQSRALLLCTSACVMNCRFCFRRHFPHAQKKEGFDQELQYLEQNPSIKEIILSGGDPLSLSNSALEDLISKLEQIPHLRRLRFHTRFPVGIPERIDADFLDLLQKSSLQIWFTIHCNHPRELDKDVVDALQKIQRLSIPILCQTVLLKGVNDDVETLKELCERLVDQGFLPYYLHQLDPVEGAAHFAVPLERGKQLMRELSTLLSGYALPKYVQEIGGQPGKTILC